MMSEVMMYVPTKLRTIAEKTTKIKSPKFIPLSQPLLRSPRLPEVRLSALGYSSSLVPTKIILPSLE